MMSKVPESFGSMVFNEKVMHERLPKDVYRALIRTMEKGRAWTAPSPTWWPTP